MKKRIILSILLVLVLLLTACAPKLTSPDNGKETVDLKSDRKIAITPDTQNNAYMARSGAVFNNVFYYSNVSLYKYLLTSEEDYIEPTPLCPDPLCQHNRASCSLYFRGYDLFVIEGSESIANNNSPIFYFLEMDCVKRYDSATNKLQVIYETDDYLIANMWMYNKQIYLTVHDGKDYMLRRIDNDGKNEINFHQENNEVHYRYFGFDGQYAYCFDQMSNAYRIDFENNTQEYLFSMNCVFNAKICDGYIYYGSDVRYDKYGEDSFSVCSLYRMKLSDLPSATPEKIDDNIIVNFLPSILSSNGMLLFNKCTPVKMGEYEGVNGDNQKLIQKVYDNGSDTMYRFDPETGKSHIVYDNFGSNLLSFYYLDDRFLIAMGLSYSFDENGEYIPESELTLFDYVNNTKQYLSHPVFIPPEH